MYIHDDANRQASFNSVVQGPRYSLMPTFNRTLGECYPEDIACGYVCVRIQFISDVPVSDISNCCRDEEHNLTTDRRSTVAPPGHSFAH